MFDYDQAFIRNLGWVSVAEQQRLRHCLVMESMARDILPELEIRRLMLGGPSFDDYFQLQGRPEHEQGLRFLLGQEAES